MSTLLGYSVSAITILALCFFVRVLAAWHRETNPVRGYIVPIHTVLRATQVDPDSSTDLTQAFGWNARQRHGRMAALIVVGIGVSAWRVF